MDEHDEDVIDMVQLIVTYGDTPENRKRLARFVKNEISAEREACATLAEGMRWHSSGPATCDAVAAAIRARSA